MLNKFVRPAIWLLVLSVGVSRVGAAEQRPITETDLLKFQWVADPRISPDGREVAFTLVTVNEKEDRYETSIWAVASSGEGPPRRLTAGPRDSSPRWSPDSRTIAFLRAGEKAPPQIQLLSMAGGEARAVTSLPKGASPAVWSPDGRTIAFTSTTTPEDLEEQKKAGDKEPAPGKKKSDVRVITRAVYRQDDEGWIDPKEHEHIWTVAADVSAEKPPAARQITSGKYDEGEVFWSRDGALLYFTSDRVDEPYYADPDDDLYSVPAAGGSIAAVIDIDGPVDSPALSPDGKSFAFAGALNPKQPPSYLQENLFLFRDGRAEDLTPGQSFELGNDIISDQHPPRGGGSSPIVWTPDSSALIVSTTDRGRSNLVRLDVASRRIEPLTSGDHEILSYSATPDASRLAVTIDDATHLSGLYLLDPGQKKLTRLTRFNDDPLAGLKLSTPEEIWYTSFDGARINAWVYRPPGASPSQKYPLILNIHGGPHTAYGWTFFHEFQLMAARGYVVLAPNPRGSTSYGNEFTNSIQYRYPGDDYKDLMAGVDDLVSRGVVDEKRLGVTGGSGGGLLTNWTITQTDRFGAAVSQRSIGDWGAFWYTTDFTLFTPTWFHTAPFQDPQEFLARSPVRYAQKISTPLLLIEGERDMRAPSGSGGETMFRALKAQKKATAMVVFPGESHELSRSGKPSHRIERLQHILNWFDKYLQGKPISTYDLQ
jgi:dipeptidyl aminopeptidase/acylaminoacyl peptidase